MADGIKTTREHLEEAVARLIQADVNPSTSAWQLVKRFFLGNAKANRIAIVAGAWLPVVRGEEGSCQLAEVPVVVRVSSRARDAAAEWHAETVAQICGDLNECGALVTRLNDLMADVTTFKAVYAENDGVVDCRIEDMHQVSDIRVRVGIVPTEAQATYEG